MTVILDRKHIDFKNNVARALALGAMKVGIDMRLCGPDSLRPDEKFIAHLCELGCLTGGQLTVTTDVATGVKGSDFIYTDVWLGNTDWKG